MNIADAFEAVARALPTTIALVASAVRRSYAELDARTGALAAELLKTGTAPNDHVALLSRNCTEWIEASLGILKARAVPLPLNYRYQVAELSQVLGQSCVTTLLAQERYLPAVRELMRLHPSIRTVIVIDDRSPRSRLDGWARRYDAVLAEGAAAKWGAPVSRSPQDHLAFCTGGTTGFPKIVIWEHRHIIPARLGRIDDPGLHLEPRTTDELRAAAVKRDRRRVLVTGPLMHGAAFCWTFSSFLQGATVLLSTDEHFDAPAIWRLVAQEKIDLITIAGDAMAQPLLADLDANGAERDLSTLRDVRSSGAAIGAGSLERLHHHLPRVRCINHVGTSETGIVGFHDVRDPMAMFKDGAVMLTPAPGVSILRDDGTVSPDGEIGWVARRGTIAEGYHGAEAATARAFLTVGGVRWATTGDLGRIEADGSLALVGRRETCINSGGEKVFAEEVEGAVRGHPAVRDAVVVGAPHERWGEIVVAIVAPTDPEHRPSLDDLGAQCRRHLAGFKVPRRLILVERIERHPSGKLDYTWARSLARTVEGD